MSTETTARTYWLHALSPVHVGIGRGVGFVDLPIIRETVTNWPYVPGSSLKGVVAALHDATSKNRNHQDGRWLAAAFGRPNGNDQFSESAGALVFSDARLTCLPVRSLYGTFAWCTCSLVLRRLHRDLTNLKVQPPTVPNDETDAARPPVRLTKNSPLNNKGVFFEDLDLSPRENDESANAWAAFLANEVFPGDTQWQTEFKRRFAIVPNEIFDFLTETATEVVARVRLKDETKTVEEGPWYEESLPAESILSGFVWGDRVFEKRLDAENGSGNAKNGDAPKISELMDKFCGLESAVQLQIGGKATVGRGRVNCRFREASAVG